MRQRYAFTLIELLCVLIILSILAALAIPTLLGQRAKAWDSSAKSDIVNAYKTMKSAWASDNAYLAAQITPAATDEPALHMVAVTAGASALYDPNTVQISIPAADTVIVTRHSKSGKDFCLVGKEATGGGVFRSWTQTTPAAITAAGCPSSTAFALGQEGGPSTSTPSAPPSYGSYFDLRADSAYGPTSTCGFNERGVNNAPFSCGTLSGGQIRDRAPTDFSLGMTGAIKGEGTSTYLGTNGSSVAVPPTTNSAVSFTGTTQYSLINDNNRMSPSDSQTGTKSWSVEAWVQPAAITNAALITLDTRWGLGLTSSGNVRMVVQQNNPWQSKFVDSSGMTLTAGQWYHIVGTFNNPAVGTATMTIYINGKASGSLVMGQATTSGGNLTIGQGAWMPTTNGFFRGSLDEFSFYNKLLTPTQIQNLYQAGCQCAVN